MSPPPGEATYYTTPPPASPGLGCVLGSKGSLSPTEERRPSHPSRCLRPCCAIRIRDDGRCPCSLLKRGGREPGRGGTRVGAKEVGLGGVRQPQYLPPLLPPLGSPPRPPPRPPRSVSRRHGLYLLSRLAPCPVRTSLTQGGAQSHTQRQNVDEGHSDLELFFSTSDVGRTPACQTPESITLHRPPGCLLPFTLKVKVTPSPA